MDLGVIERQQALSLAVKRDGIIFLLERIASNLPGPNDVADVVRDYADERQGTARNFYPPYSRAEAELILDNTLAEGDDS